jgi:hypothetical protein
MKSTASLFSGAGGFDLGCGVSFEIGIAIDNNPMLAYAVAMQIKEHLESHVSDTLLCKARNLLWVCLHRMPLLDRWEYALPKTFGLSFHLPQMSHLSIKYQIPDFQLLSFPNQRSP